MSEILTHFMATVLRLSPSLLAISALGGCNKSPYNEFKPRSDHVGPGGAFGWPLGGGEKGP